MQHHSPARSAGAAPPRRLLIGTGAGVFVATPDDRGGYALRATGPEDCSVSAVLLDKDDPRRIYAATRNEGLWVSPDGGASWQERNRGILYKDLWYLAQHPRSGEIYLAGRPPSIFKSADRGETWTHLRSLHTLEESLHWTMPRAPHIAHVKHIALREDDPTWVCAAIEEGWLVRSTDGGQSWVTLKQGVAFDAHAVMAWPDDPRLLLATTGEGVFRSENGGDTFSRSDQGIEAPFSRGAYVSPPGMHPARPEVVFVGAAEVPPPIWHTRREGAGSSFYRSDDRGRTWKKLPGEGLPGPLPGAVRSCVADPWDPDRFYFGTTDGQVWVTPDGGASFRLVAESLPGGWIAGLCPAGPGP